MSRHTFPELGSFLPLLTPVVSFAFFLLELGGTVFLFLGFLLSARFVEREKGSPLPAAVPTKGPKGA